MKKELVIGNKIVVFEGKNIRRYWDDEKELWYFSVVDVIAILTDSSNPGVYWRVLKKRLLSEGANETVTKCNGLKMPAADGKMRVTDMADTETMFRLVQSVPSPKAEPFKRWLAKVGYERVQEIEDPELASKRAKALYKAKGYPQSWIEKRVRGIAIREELTDEWKKRKVGGDQKYAILTAEISKATFGVTLSEYKNLKGLKRENLRDHMTDLELIFTMLGEASTTEITRKDDAKGFEQNKSAAVRGGRVAGNARKELETQTNQSVVTKQNYLRLKEKTKNNFNV
ncbi:MAG: phage antirepressor protein [Deltaproteobacteria bacterium GWA2_45_12]|nr:MAG: phage antirepressor protein [Deltaproteobacteria bacterium GWA2_45_12]